VLLRSATRRAAVKTVLTVLKGSKPDRESHRVVAAKLTGCPSPHLVSATSAAPPTGVPASYLCEHAGSVRSRRAPKRGRGLHPATDPLFFLQKWGAGVKPRAPPSAPPPPRCAVIPPSPRRVLPRSSYPFFLAPSPELQTLRRTIPESDYILFVRLGLFFLSGTRPSHFLSKVAEGEVDFVAHLNPNKP
jgi:hypothetical protein